MVTLFQLYNPGVRIQVEEPAYSKATQVIGKTFYTRVNIWYKLPGSLGTLWRE
jgi:hypothetical protein